MQRTTHLDLKRAPALGAALGALVALLGCSSGGGSRVTMTLTEVSLETSTGTLHGTLTVPGSAAPYPLALIHAGSGPTDRDGNSGTAVVPDSLKLLAEGLATRGVASLRYDKRGVGASAAAGPSEESLVIETYVDDLTAWTRKLAADSRFERITIVGHSEGALIGTLSAEAEPPDSLVSLEGAGRRASDLIRAQLAASGQLTDLQLSEVNDILTHLEQGANVPVLPADLASVPSLASLLRASVQPYLVSWFAYDPPIELGKLALPIRVVQGTTDTQVSQEDANLLVAGNGAAKLALINGMNHLLKAATLDAASQQATLTDPSLPVVPAMLDAVSEAAIGP